MKSTAKLISFGLGGHRVEFDDHSSLSGYDTPDSWERRFQTGDLLMQGDRYPQGTPVVDLRAVVRRRPGLAFASPMCEGAFAPGQIDAFDKQEAVNSIVTQAILRDPTNGYAPILALGLTHDPTDGLGPLDRVAPDVYVAWWRSRGARIGRLGLDGILWDGAAEVVVS